MRSTLQWLRRVLRFALAIFLWLNALLLLRLAPPSLAPLAARLRLTPSEATLLVLLAVISLLASYGLDKVIVDALYIYFFPVVVLYLTAKAIYRAGRWFVATTSPHAGQGNELLVQKASEQVVATPANAGSEQPWFKFSWHDLARHLSRPFRHFTVLWGLLVLFASHRWLLETALTIFLVHLARTLYRVLVLAVISLRGLTQLEERIRQYAELWIGKALAVGTQAEPVDDARKAWGILTLLGLGVQLFRNRQRIAQWVIFLGALVFGTLYLYLAVLFSFAYCGLAALGNVPYRWGDSLVTSLFIPFEFSDLPHTAWIKLVAGIHCTLLLVVGIGTIFGYIQKKMNSLYAAADFLGTRLADDHVRAQMVIFNEKFGVKAQKQPNA